MTARQIAFSEEDDSNGNEQFSSLNDSFNFTLPKRFPTFTYEVLHMPPALEGQGVSPRVLSIIRCLKMSC